MTVVCTGSIAYDYILSFKGHFKDHILLDKTHILNLSFLVDDLQKRRGGVAGHSAPNPALLCYPPPGLAPPRTDAAQYPGRRGARGPHSRGPLFLLGWRGAPAFPPTSRDEKGLLELAEMVVTTLGRNGSRIATRKETIEIPAAPPSRESDPTGAGDAYRAGLVAGLLRGLKLAEAGRVASLAASYAIEQGGTIEHGYTQKEFSRRYRTAFGKDLPEKFWNERPS